MVLLAERDVLRGTLLRDDVASDAAPAAPALPLARTSGRTVLPSESAQRVFRWLVDSGPCWRSRDRLPAPLALAIGAEADGAVRSNVRKALQHGATVEELRAVTLATITTCGFPTAIAALRWIDEVLSAAEAAPEPAP